METLRSTDEIRISEHITARLVKSTKKRSLLELAIFLHDGVTREELGKALPKIKQIRQGILIYQGTNFYDFEQLFRLYYLRLFNDGYSYLEIVMEINYEVLTSLIYLVSCIESGHIDSADATRSGIKSRLTAVGLSADEISSIIDKGIEDIKAGRAPWGLKDGAVNKQQVINAQRQFIKDLKKRKVVIRNRPETSPPNEVYPFFYMNVEGFYDMLRAWKEARVNFSNGISVRQLLSQLEKSGGLGDYLKAPKRKGPRKKKV